MTVEQGHYEGLAGVRLALRQFLAFSELATKAAKVTPAQYQAMLVIKTAPGGTVAVKDLADQMLIKPNGAVQLIDRLVYAGLTERHPSPDDRRSVLVALTAKGAAALADLAAAHLREMLRHEPLLADSLRRLRQIPAAAEPAMSASNGAYGETNGLRGLRSL